MLGLPTQQQLLNLISKASPHLSLGKYAHGKCGCVNVFFVSVSFCLRSCGSAYDALTIFIEPLVKHYRVSHKSGPAFTALIFTEIHRKRRLSFLFCYSYSLILKFICFIH